MYNDLKQVLNNGNIFNFKLKGDLPLHNFILLHYNNNWYLIQSYSNICEMNVTKDNNLPVYLQQLLETGSIPLYNALYKTEINNNGTLNKIYYQIKTGYFTELPIVKLRNKIETYLLS